MVALSSSNKASLNSYLNTNNAGITSKKRLKPQDDLFSTHDILGGLLTHSASALGFAVVTTTVGDNFHVAVKAMEGRWIRRGWHKLGSQII
jgi:hypothetical protein